MKRFVLIFLAASCLFSACEKDALAEEPKYEEPKYGLTPITIPFVILDEEGNNILDVDENCVNEIYIKMYKKTYYPNPITRTVKFPINLIVDDDTFVFGEFDWNAKEQFDVYYQNYHWEIELESHTDSYFKGDPSTRIDLYVDGALTEMDDTYNAYILQM